MILGLDANEIFPTKMRFYYSGNNKTFHDQRLKLE